MKTARALMTTFVALALCLAVTQAKPNFTGDWKMNAAKSNFGAMPPPTSYAQKITHNEPDLKVASTWVGEWGEFSTDFSYTTDGKECRNTSQMGESRSTLKWDDDILIIETKMDFQGSEVTMVAKWTLSEDGKTLTANQHFSGPQGEGDSTVVMDKQ